MPLSGPLGTKNAFTLIELLVVIAIIAILAVVVVVTLNPAELLRQARDANRLSDLATLNSALSLYATDQSGSQTFSLGNASSVYLSLPDASSTCTNLGLPTSSGSFTYACSSSTSSKSITNGWIPVNLSLISSGSPLGALPIDPTNQSSSGLYYTYYTNGTQFEVTALFESQKNKTQYGQKPIVPGIPELNAQGSSLSINPLYNPQGLVGYWPMDEGSGSSTIDASGNGNVGTWVGTASGTNSTYYTQGKVGAGAGVFDGSSNDDHISLPSASLSPTSAWTISAWVQPTGSAASSGVIFSKWESSNGIYVNYQFDIGLGGGHDLRLHVGASPSGSGGVTYITGNTTMTLGQWYHVVGVFDGATQKLSVYVNGLSDATPVSTTFSQCATNTANPYIGAFNFPWSNYQNAFTGSIDDLRIYNRALSAAEIQALYNAEK